MRVSAGYIERVARDWQSAFERANGRAAPTVSWDRGWFIIDQPSRPRYRRAELEAMTETLRRIAQGKIGLPDASRQKQIKRIEEASR